MSDRDLERLVVLVRREIGAVDVRIDPDGAEPPDGAEDRPAVACPLPGGRGRIVARLAGRGADAAEAARRLAALVESFGATLEAVRPARRAPAESELREVLGAMAGQAGALAALVIDAGSPVVWASAGARTGDAPGSEAAPVAGGEVVSLFARRDRRARTAPDLPRRAVAVVRALPATASLRAGGKLRLATSEPGFGILARSFASIYVLVVVFDGPWDELRAERAVGRLLPRVERLVLALPPMDPRPAAGARALRRRGRR